MALAGHGVQQPLRGFCEPAGAVLSGQDFQDLRLRLQQSCSSSQRCAAVGMLRSTAQAGRSLWRQRPAPCTSCLQLAAKHSRQL